MANSAVAPVVLCLHSLKKPVITYFTIFSMLCSHHYLSTVEENIAQAILITHTTGHIMPHHRRHFESVSKPSATVIHVKCIRVRGGE